jgi:hypothetical protein
MRLRRNVIAGIVGLTLCAGAAQANLITNGDFSTGDFTGWDTTANTFVVISDDVLPGTPEIALIGALNLSGTRSISQDFTVPTADHWLTVSFDYGFGGITAPGADLFEAFVEISGFDTVTLLSVTSGSGLFLMVDSVTMMFEVSGADLASPNATISFEVDEASGFFSGFSGAGVDNIVVEAKVHVPEPGTLAVLALGLVGLGLVRRKRTL